MKKRNSFVIALICGALWFNLSSLYADANTLRSELAAEIAKKTSVKPYGTNPGYYDQSMKANYETALAEAQALIDASSDDETALSNAKTTLVAAMPTIIFPTAGKTYYIQAPRPVGSFATSTGLNNNIQCKNLVSNGTEEQKNAQKWTIVTKGDGFLITNVDGGYMSTDNTNVNGQTTSILQTVTAEQTNPIYFEISTDNNGAPTDGSKRFLISRPSNAFRLHAGGTPTSLMNWTGAAGTGSKTDNSSWIFIEVSSKNDLETAISLATTQLNYYINGGGVVGSISTSEYEAFKAKIDAAQAVVDNPESTEENYKTTLAAIVAETEAFTPTMVEPTLSDESGDNWYLIHNVWQASKYMTSPDSEGSILLSDRTSASNQLWKLMGDGAGKIKLVSHSGLTIAAGPAASSGEGTWMSYEQKKPNQYAFTFDGKTPGANDEGMHCGTPEATTIVSWNNSGSSNWWTFEEATKNMDDLNDLIAAADAVKFGTEGHPVDSYPRKQEFVDALTSAKAITESSLFNDYYKCLNILQKEYDDAIASIAVGTVDTRSNIRIFVENGRLLVTGTTLTPVIFTQTGIQIDAQKNLSKGVYIVRLGDKVQKVMVK